MLVYRVCNEVEANYQKVGEPWRKLPGKQEIYNLGKPGLYLTLFPELWRRLLNTDAYNSLKREVDCFHTHTLYLDAPAEKLEKYEETLYRGMQYRLDFDIPAIVRGIAGPGWPLPDWVPQPTNEEDWDPYSRNYDDIAIRYWIPRGVDPSTLWYHPDQPGQRQKRREFMEQLRIQKLFGARILQAMR